MAHHAEVAELDEVVRMQKRIPSRNVQVEEALRAHTPPRMHPVQTRHETEDA